MASPDDDLPATRGDILRLERHIRRAFDRACGRLLRVLGAKIDAVAELVAARDGDADRILAKLDAISQKLEAWRGLDPDSDAAAKPDSLH